MRNKTKQSVIQELNENGIAVIENYFDEDFCKTAIKELNKVIGANTQRIYSQSNEGTAGDSRIFKIENQSPAAQIFQSDEFINQVIRAHTNNSFCSHFILGGKVKFQSHKVNNSGGGWHRDADEPQYKVMLYLNDVDKKNGPFLFLKNSKKYDLKRRAFKGKRTLLQKIYILLGKINASAPRYEDEVVEEYIADNEKPMEVKGQAGTIVFFDGSYLHRGKNLEEDERYTLTNYYYKSSWKSKLAIHRQFKDLFIDKK